MCILEVHRKALALRGIPVLFWLLVSLALVPFTIYGIASRHKGFITTFLKLPRAMDHVYIIVLTPADGSKTFTFVFSDEEVANYASDLFYRACESVGVKMKQTLLKAPVYTKHEEVIKETTSFVSSARYHKN